MKWLRENWTKVVLIGAVLVIAYFWWGNSQSKKEIDRLEFDIELRQDSITTLNTLVDVEKLKAEGFEGEIDSLEILIDEKSDEIELVDGKLANALKEIDDLTPTESVNLLAGNLSEEMGEDITLELKPDSTIILETDEVTTVNKVFEERNVGLEKIKMLTDVNVLQEVEINTQKLLVSTHVNTIDLLEETIVQKDEIIANKDGIIEEKDKRSKKDKAKFFAIGAGSGGALILLILLL